METNATHLAKGDFLKKLNEELVNVAENIDNEDVEFSKQRSIKVTLTFKPNKETNAIDFNSSFITSLAGPKSDL